MSEVWVVIHDEGQSGREVVAIHSDEMEATARAVQIVVDAVEQHLRDHGHDDLADDLGNQIVDAGRVAELLGCDDLDLATLLDEQEALDRRLEAAQAVIPWLTDEMGEIAVERHTLQ